MCLIPLFLDKAATTLPRVERDRLMDLCSSICPAVSFSSICIFSLPARSQRFSFALMSFPLFPGFTLSTTSWNKECDLDEAKLDFVCLVILLCSPLLSRYRQSSGLVITYSLSPSTKVPEYLSSLIVKGLLASLSWNKSYSFSLYIWMKDQKTVNSSKVVLYNVSISWKTCLIALGIIPSSTLSNRTTCSSFSL